MKMRALSLTLAALMTCQFPVWAQSSRTDGIGDQQIALAQQEMAIIRHDLERLKASLTETETALRDKQSQWRVSNILSVGTATVGLSLAALTATSTLTSGKVKWTIVTVNAALSAVAGYIDYRETKYLPTDAADRAVIKARQEIMAARASGDDGSTEALDQLDQSLESIQTALNDYRKHQTVNRRIHLAGTISQTAGTAMSIGLALGVVRQATLSRLLMASGNIATILQALTPAKTEQVLAEIAQTREAVNTALENL
ncbi:MAG: hypothetical protein JSU04_18325 [Bdellovibrionales bacterium]|nr:hypothetical protein [Bdellovibrionales bacterium]